MQNLKSTRRDMLQGVACAIPAVVLSTGTISSRKVQESDMNVMSTIERAKVQPVVHADQKVVDLAITLERAIERYRLAMDANSRADERYFATRPDQPKKYDGPLPELFDSDGNPRSEVIAQHCAAEKRRWEKYREADAKARQDCGCEQAEKELSRKLAVADRIARRLLDTPTTTTLGLAIKLSVVEWFYQDDENVQQVLSWFAFETKSLPRFVDEARVDQPDA